MPGPMYEFVCLSGHHFEVEDPSDRCCPECGRSLSIDTVKVPAQLFRSECGAGVRALEQGW
jgi:hypothetical protein